MRMLLVRSFAHLRRYVSVAEETQKVAAVFVRTQVPFSGNSSTLLLGLPSAARTDATDARHQ